MILFMLVADIYLRFDRGVRWVLKDENLLEMRETLIHAVDTNQRMLLLLINEENGIEYLVELSSSGAVGGQE